MSGNTARNGAVLAVAGRRIDAHDATQPRFPLAAAPSVRAALLRVMTDAQAQGLVSSAACGADLLAQEVAANLGLPRRIVLPYAAERFRATSVTDRPGDWGSLFDRLYGAAAAGGAAVVLPEAGSGDAAFAAANERILEEAAALATELAAGRVVAVVVWDGAAHSAEDSTAHFAHLARQRELEVISVPTLTG